jgi:hypothetical protein
VFESVAAALARLIARLRSASPHVRPNEVTRALDEDARSRTQVTDSDTEEARLAQRARAAAEVARRARRGND